MTAPLTEDERTWRGVPERVWVARNTHGDLLIYPRMPEHRQAVEFMRVLSRQEIEKLASDVEGVDTQQLLNSQQRTIEGQRKHIGILQERIARLQEMVHT